jgi:parvulin-like peptidyl-prolyl isomerase
MFDGRLRAGLLTAIALGFAIGCSSRHGRVGAEASASGDGGARAAPPANPVYPPGRWRLASEADLSRSIVWLSHIAVMHRGSQPARSGLRAGAWSPDTLPDRSREEAYEIARGLLTRLRANPAAFADLARAHSDDVVTSARGGSLGGVHAERLPWSFLDALAALRPGQVSEVVETPMGFHILLMRSPPPAEEVSGARIVVRYQSTAGEAPSGRSRGEALQLAASLAAQARAGADFSDLVRRHSDGADNVRDGVMGVWSTRSPGLENPTLIDALAGMDLGEVSDPIDSAAGFQIVKRVAVLPMAEFGMRAIKVPVYSVVYATGQSQGGEPAPDRAHRDAERIARALRRSPDAFATFAAQYCCRAAERWAEGHGDPTITSALEKLGVGEFTASPVRVGGSYVVAQRLDPELLCPPAQLLAGLPSPDRVDLEDVIRANSSERLASGLAELSPLLETLKLPQAEHDVLTRGLEGLREDLVGARTPDARATAYRTRIARIHSNLSESSYARAIANVEQWATSQILAGQTH